MKAAQFFGRRDLRVIDVPKPEAKDNEAIVNIEWCGICGSDLHEYIAGSTITFLARSSAYLEQAPWSFHRRGNPIL